MVLPMLLLLSSLVTLGCSTEPTECVEWVDTCDCDSVAACVSQDEAKAATICDIHCERETGGEGPRHLRAHRGRLRVSVGLGVWVGPWKLGAA